MNSESRFLNASGLRDNYTRGTVADFLRAKIKTGSKLSIVSAYFTIYAFETLKDELERINHLDFLFGEPSGVLKSGYVKFMSQRHPEILVQNEE
jgi:hypothetical protein